MRRREEQRRRFHEALINMLYPEPSPPSITVEEERNEDEPANIIIPQETPDAQDHEWKSSSDGGGKDGKLTRAQRKRLRKRKLKEDSTRRGKLIGPLLHFTGEEADPQGVRPNVTLNSNVRIQNEASAFGDCASSSSSSSKSKVKQRRKTRKLAKTLPVSADAEKLIGDAKTLQESDDAEKLIGDAVRGGSSTSPSRTQEKLTLWNKCIS